ncbi:T9SS type B sorting domain-containing protein, partial [Algoriphagus sp. AK58]|uniref:T9SS type B sorting domain-containing protein n=1 Tax=Algoriphagus sp. AK58 TaxID=1406877 RepID=UPI00164FCF36
TRLLHLPPRPLFLTILTSTPNLKYFRGGRVQVFDRDGRRLFYTESPTVSWDGTYEGKEMPTGTYIWILESRETGEVRRGTLTLIRQ